MRKIIGFRTLCVGLGIWVGLLWFLLRGVQGITLESKYCL